VNNAGLFAVLLPPRSAQSPGGIPCPSLPNVDKISTKTTQPPAKPEWELLAIEMQLKYVFEHF